MTYIRQVVTSTTIPEDVFAKIKANKWRVNELVLLGVHAKENNPQLIERIKELESGNDRLQKRLTALYNEVYK